MKIEKLNNDKIKVTLTASELSSFDIDLRRLSPNSKELHMFLFGIMETIREETGFNPYNGQVVVEATPMQGGISIVVSKLRLPAKTLTKDEIKSGVMIKAKTRKNQSHAIYYFDDFDNMCMAIMGLDDDDLREGSLYSLNDRFCFAAANASVTQKCTAVMSEFAARQSRYPLQLTYIKEHGELIAEGEKLCEMARGLKKIY